MSQLAFRRTRSRPPARRVIVVALLMSIGAGRLFAQGPQLGFHPSADDRRTGPIPAICAEADPARLVAGGLVGGIVGMYAGAIALSAVTKGSTEDGDLYAAVVGGLFGEIAGVAMGAHLSNRSRGDPFATLAASAAGFFAGAWISSQLDDRLDWLAVPLVQLPLAVIVEHRSARARARPRPECNAI